MKRNNRNRTRTLVTPIKVDLSEAEIMADLEYPAMRPRPVVSRIPEKRITTS